MSISIHVNEVLFHSSFSKTLHVFLIAIAKLKFKEKITKTLFIRVKNQTIITSI